MLQRLGSLKHGVKLGPCVCQRCRGRRIACVRVLEFSRRWAAVARRHFGAGEKQNYKMHLPKRQLMFSLMCHRAHPRKTLLFSAVGSKKGSFGDKCIC